MVPEQCSEGTVEKRGAVCAGHSEPPCAPPAHYASVLEGRDSDEFYMQCGEIRKVSVPQLITVGLGPADPDVRGRQAG